MKFWSLSRVFFFFFFFDAYGEALYCKKRKRTQIQGPTPRSRRGNSRMCRPPHIVLPTESTVSFLHKLEAYWHGLPNNIFTSEPSYLYTKSSIYGCFHVIFLRSTTNRIVQFDWPNSWTISHTSPLHLSTLPEIDFFKFYRRAHKCPDTSAFKKLRDENLSDQKFGLSIMNTKIHNDLH